MSYVTEAMVYPHVIQISGEAMDDNEETIVQKITVFLDVMPFSLIDRY
jgi:hypothetical protein